MTEVCMKRREFVEKVSMGSAVLLAGGALGKPEKAPAKAAKAPAKQEGHEHGPVNGDKAHAVVAFGQWIPFDRLNNPPGPGTPPNPPGGPNDRTKNHHVLTPFEVTIKPGGAVSFIISGFHLPTIYGPGTQFDDVDKTKLIPAGGGFPALVDDPTDRIFGGIDPRSIPTQQDRIENVTISEPGRYLVVCTVLPHFNDRMHGFINVRGEDETKG